MKKAQGTLEFAVLIVALVAALLAMQIYIKRAIQGRLRQTADDLGAQYAPRATTSVITIKQDSDINTTTETVEDNGVYKTTTTTKINNQTDTRQGNETVGAQESSLY